MKQPSEKIIPPLYPNKGPSIEGVDIPNEFYWVLQHPIPLAGMRYPRIDFPWANIYTAGFRHVVSLHPGPYNPEPLTILFNERLEDLISGGPPANEVEEIAKIKRAVTVTATAWKSGQGVVVHCIGGRGRSGTVIGCVLREIGFKTNEVVTFLDQLHRTRGRPGWPESPWQLKLVEVWGTNV